MVGPPETYSVEFALLVQGEGLVILCCFPDVHKAVVHGGDAIELLRPDGTKLQTQVKGLHMFMVPAGRPGLIGLRLPDEVNKDDIPRGTRLRLIGGNDMPVVVQQS
jgi:hypothetical protein